jgi:rhamnose utilization protein RhaD (predicted bifunctional aldolase and dehydrogenase)
MGKGRTAIEIAEITQLRELSARIGSDPLLTQASTGNSSIKLDGVLWIKASGRWMANAVQEDILIPLALADVRESVKQKVNPAERYTGASVETAMHAVLPHRVVLHVHCVNTIAWAVRRDARGRLQRKLDGLRWQWISYVPSGLPLAGEIETALSFSGDTDVFILGNHGLVIGGDDCSAVEKLLSEIERRLAVSPRRAPPTDYDALAPLTDGSVWDLPDDDGAHALGTDPISRGVLSRGFLHPSQAILSNSNAAVFGPIPRPNPTTPWRSRYCKRSFLIVDGCGVIVSETITPVERKILSGLAQVVQRIDSSAGLRYLTAAEAAECSVMAIQYREGAECGGRRSQEPRAGPNPHHDPRSGSSLNSGLKRG